MAIGAQRLQQKEPVKFLFLFVTGTNELIALLILRGDS